MPARGSCPWTWPVWPALQPVHHQQCSSFQEPKFALPPLRETRTSALLLSRRVIHRSVARQHPRLRRSQELRISSLPLTRHASSPACRRRRIQRLPGERHTRGRETLRTLIGGAATRLRLACGTRKRRSAHHPPPAVRRLPPRRTLRRNRPARRTPSRRGAAPHRPTPEDPTRTSRRPSEASSQTPRWSSGMLSPPPRASQPAPQVPTRTGTARRRQYILMCGCPPPRVQHPPVAREPRTPGPP